MATLQLFQNRKIKIFSKLTETLRELASYSRSPKGIVKRNDHLMDALRYIVLSGIANAQPLYDPPKREGPYFGIPKPHPQAWLAL